MANSTSNLPQIAEAQADKEVTANALFDALSQAGLYGRNGDTTTALTWGYLGGNLSVAGVSTAIVNGTVLLTASATNYVEATTAGVVSTNTSAFTGGRIKLYTVVTGANSVTSYTDHRTTEMGAAAAGGTTLPVADTQTLVKGSSDATKLLRIEADGITTATTRVWTAQNMDLTVAGIDVQQAYSKNQRVTPATLTDGANIAVDASLSNNFKVTLGGNRTLDNPTNLSDGMVLNFVIKQDGTGTRTLAYGSKYSFPSGTAPTLTTTASAKDFMSCYYDSGADELFCVMTLAHS